MCNLDRAIAKYAAALTVIKDAPSIPSLEQILEVLLARDAVKSALVEHPRPSKTEIGQLIQLDNVLADLAGTMTQDDSLLRCRQSVNPPKSAWWWFLESLPRKPQPQPKWAKYDWLWNFGTVVCLVISTTFLSQTVRAFSTVQGLDLLGVLSTISQGAGVALVAGGALTDKGRHVVEKALTSLKIRPYLHAEATFVGAVVLLGTSYAVYNNLPWVGELYYQQGRRQQAENRWSEAQESYARALNFVPDDPKVGVAVGSIYETLGDFNKAIAEYEKGMLVGDPAAMNALGRALIWQAWEKSRWMGKIDEETARSAELLFERASKIADRQPDGNDGKLLQASIRTNQGLLAWAKVGWNNPQGLLDRLWLFENAVALEQEARLSHQRTILFPSEFRTECYNSLGTLFNFAFERPPAGVDPRVAYQDFKFSCLEIQQVYHPENLYDSKVLESALALREVDGRLQSFQTLAIPIAIKDPALLAKLQQLLSERIQKNLDPQSLPQEKLILRVFVNSGGKILRYYSYDKMSHGFAYGTPIYDLFWDDNGTPPESQEPIAEFRVVFDPAGTFEVVPWNSPLTGAIDNSAEIGVAQSRLFEQLDRVVSDRFDESASSSADEIFFPSLMYRVNVTPEGAIAEIRPLNQEARNYLESTPLAQLPKAEGTEEAVVSLKVEFKASKVFRVLPWTE